VGGVLQGYCCERLLACSLALSFCPLDGWRFFPKRFRGDITGPCDLEDVRYPDNTFLSLLCSIDKSSLLSHNAHGPIFVIVYSNPSTCSSSRTERKYLEGIASQGLVAGVGRMKKGACTKLGDFITFATRRCICIQPTQIVSKFKHSHEL
jgi:hypothetical protein